MKPVRLPLLVIVLFALFLFGCARDRGGGSTPGSSMDETGMAGQTDEDPYSREMATDLNRFSAAMHGIIQSHDRAWKEKHQAIRQLGKTQIPLLIEKLETLADRAAADPALSGGQLEKASYGLMVAGNHLTRFLQILDYEIPDLPASPPKASPFSLAPTNEVLDRYWMLYHYTEILGVYNDETGYESVWAPSGRTSFIEQEVGAFGIEMQCDWWYLPLAIWNDSALTAEQKLMSTKFTMWQNPDWGGGDHYIDEYWSWEPGYKDEDAPLFTGNLMAGLAAEYSITRSPRTLRRLHHLVDAILFFDAISRDEPFDWVFDQHGGRIQRGPKTYNLYPEDEQNLFTVTVDSGGVHGHHNNSWPHHETGREMKNVSRDQYYGTLTGYYAIYHFFTRLESLSPGEEELLEKVTDHSKQILAYLTSTRERPDYGLLYNLYATFEGSCANPPNLSFMGYAAYVGLEEMAGRETPSNDMGLALFRALLDLGVLIGSVDLAAALFNPAHTGLTAMNQYVAALFMSDLPREHWEFIFPGAIIADGSSGQRKLWRRMIAAYAVKFGDLGNSDYEGVIDEMLDPANNPAVAIDTVFNSIRNGHAVIEPAGVGIEDLLWPAAFVFAAASNHESIGEDLNDRYDALIGAGTMKFDHTDVEP